MDADDIIINLDRVSERRIQEGIEAGEFDDLTGMGKPLKDNHNPFVPEDMRAAFTVLSNSGHAPDWMQLAQEIEADLAALRHNADRHFQYLRRQMQEIGGNPYAVKRLRQEMDRLRATHKRAAERHSRGIEEVNRKIHTFNQIVPVGSLLKVPLSHSIEMARYEDRVPAYLMYGT